MHGWFPLNPQVARYDVPQPELTRLAGDRYVQASSVSLASLRIPALTDIPALILSILLLGVLFVVGDSLRALATGKLSAPPRPRNRLTFELPVLFSALVLLIVPPIALQLILVGHSQTGPPARGVEATILAHFFSIGALLPILVATGKNRLSDFGIDGQGWRDEMRYGGLGYLASIPPVIVVMVLMIPFRSPETRNPLLKLLEQTSSPWTIVEVTFLAAVSAPLLEELIFRAVFQGLLESLLRPLAAILIPAGLFAVVHGPFDALPLLPLAIILGVVYHVRRSYVAVVTIHALFNATFLILDLWGRGAGPTGK